MFGVEIRNPGLNGKRLDLSLRVPNGASPGATARENRKEAERREAAVHLMVERGEWTLLADLRAGKFGVVDLANAVRDGRLDALRRFGEAPLTLGEMADRVRTEKAATKQRGTVDRYEFALRSLEQHFGRDTDLTAIGSDEAKGWLYGVKGSGRQWAPNTQAGAHMVASVVWRTAITLESERAERTQSRPRLSRSVWESVQPAERRKTRHAFLEPAEWTVLLERVRGRPQAAFFALGCLLGLRVDEVMHLRTGIDVDLSKGLVKVQPREGEFAWRPKHDNSVRDIPVTPAAREILQHHAERYAGDRYFIVSAKGDRPISHTLAQRWTQEWFEAAGLKYGRAGEALTFHSLRHTLASWLVREGWSSSLVAKILGNTAHEVDRTYAHLNEVDTLKVILTVDRITNGGAK